MITGIGCTKRFYFGFTFVELGLELNFVKILTNILHIQDRNFPNTLIEMKRLAEESNRFRVEEIPPRLREKEKLFAVFKDLERQMRDMNFELDRDLYPDNIERSWSQLMMLYQVTDDNCWVSRTVLMDRPLIKTQIECSQDLRG